MRQHGSGLRYRLRTFAILVSGAALVLGAWTASANRQRRAVETILQKQGDVAYSFNRRASGASLPPQWMMNREVRDYFFPVVGIGIREDAELGDQDLAVLAALPQIEDLQLHGPKFSDAALDQLAKLRRLRKIALVNTRITDDGLSRLAAMSALEEIGLCENATTPGGLARLADALPQCVVRH